MSGYPVLICHLKARMRLFAAGSRLPVARYWLKIAGFAHRSFYTGGLLVTGCMLLVSSASDAQVCSINTSHTDVLCFGESTGTISITASGGAEPYTFSWTGPGSFSGTSRNLTDLAAGSYTVTVTGNSGSCTGTATVVISQPEHPLSMASQPEDQTDCYGNTVEFPAQVDGFVGPVNYQWQSKPPGGEFSDISGESSSGLVVRDIGVNGLNIHGTEYRVVVSDKCSTIVSEPALLEINAVTGLTGAVNLTICSGSGTSYEVSTRGNVTGYRWSFYDGMAWQPISDGSSYSGTTSRLLAISDATPVQTGGYRVSVTFSTLNQPEAYPECVVTTHTRNRNLTVMPPVSAIVLSPGQEICYSATPDPLTAASSSGGSGPPYSYQWQISIDGENWSDLTGEQGLTYSPPPLISTTLYRIAVTDEGPMSCETVYSYPVTLTVNPLPVTSSIYHN